ncbi:MAG: hypothetical protein DWH91_06485 [Planctomycetota bacterium]|nr:MAG: hypothetical protein DWH91_06485 [Planctomycetota bacterium]
MRGPARPADELDQGHTPSPQAVTLIGYAEIDGSPILSLIHGFHHQTTPSFGDPRLDQPPASMSSEFGSVELLLL